MKSIEGFLRTSSSLLFVFCFLLFFCLGRCKMKRAQLHLDTQSLARRLKLRGGAFAATAGACNISGYWIERDMKRGLRLSALLTGSRSWEMVGGASGCQHQWHCHCLACQCNWQATVGAGLTGRWRAEALKCSTRHSERNNVTHSRLHLTLCCLQNRLSYNCLLSLHWLTYITAFQERVRECKSVQHVCSYIYISIW